MRYGWGFVLLGVLLLPGIGSAEVAAPKAPLAVSVGDINLDGEEDLAIVSQSKPALRVVSRSQPAITIREFPLMPGDTVTAISTQPVSGANRPLVVAHTRDRTGKRIARVFSYRSSTPVQVVQLGGEE